MLYFQYLEKFSKTSNIKFDYNDNSELFYKTSLDTIVSYYSKEFNIINASYGNRAIITMPLVHIFDVILVDDEDYGQITLDLLDIDNFKNKIKNLRNFILEVYPNECFHNEGNRLLLLYKLCDKYDYVSQEIINLFRKTIKDSELSLYYLFIYEC